MQTTRTSNEPFKDLPVKDNFLLPIGNAVQEHSLLMANRKLRDDLRVTCVRRRTLSKKFSEIQEAEQRRISRELHDSMGQGLTTLGIQVGMAIELLKKGDAKTAIARMNDCSRQIGELAQSVRHIVTALRPAVLDDYGLSAALRWHMKQFAARTGLNTRIDIRNVTPRLPPPHETTLFRIAQEALNNILKHADAQTVSMSLTETADAVLLVVKDDGRGFAHSEQGFAPRKGWGLAIMRERAEAIGACFTVNSTPGKETVIEVATRRKQKHEHQRRTGR